MQRLSLHLQELLQILNEFVTARGRTLRCFNVLVELTTVTVDRLNVVVVRKLSFQDYYARATYTLKLRERVHILLDFRGNKSPFRNCSKTLRRNTEKEILRFNQSESLIRVRLEDLIEAYKQALSN